MGLKRLTDNPSADKVIKNFLPLEKYIGNHTPDKISRKEEWKQHQKRMAAENRRAEVAKNLFEQISEKDIEPDAAVEEAAKAKIQQKIGAEGWMITWKYRSGKGYKTRGHCTVCGSEMDLYPEDNGYCPDCGAPVAYLHVTPAGRRKSISTTVLQFRRSSTGHILAVQYYCEQSCIVTGKGKDREVRVRWHQDPMKVTLFDKKNLYGYQRCGTRWEVEKTAGDGWPEIILPIDWNIFEGTALQNSHVWDYVDANKYPYPIGYCRRYLQYPGIETLANAGLWKIVEEIIYDLKQSRGNINLKEKSPAKILGLNRTEIARCKAEKWSATSIAAYHWLKDNNLPTTNEEIDSVLGFWGSENYRTITKKASPEQERETYRYLCRKKMKEKMSTHTLTILYKDYLEFASRLGYDLSDGKNRYPAKLKVMHDRLSEQITAQENAAANEKIQKVAAHLAQYTWQKDGFVIRPAGSAQELIDEGKMLHHCVGTYVDRYASGKTALFFIRHADSPDEPFYTLELDEQHMTVKQNHGAHNSLQTPEVKAFEEKWLKWAKRQKAKSKAQKQEQSTPAA